MKNDEMNKDPNGPVMDEERVGDAVSQYFGEHPELLEGVEPSHDLWAGIESRIQARVVPLSGHSTNSHIHASAQSGIQSSTRKHWGWMSMSAAAAVLVVSTASVTYVLTRRGAEPLPGAPAPASIAANQPTSPNAATSVASNAAAATAPTDSTLKSQTPVQTSLASAGPRKPATARDDDGGKSESASAGRRGVAQLVSRPGLQGRDEVRSTYDEEITTLRAALESRRGQLDPATVSTIEQNLQVIDNAIHQAKAALMKDPRSRFLNDQLDRSLAKKTDLLRAAALLPSV